MIRSNLCNYSDSTQQLQVWQWIILIKKVIFQNCAPFTDSITEINNVQVNDAQKKLCSNAYVYNLIGYSDAYSKTSWSLWQYYRDEPVSHNNDNIIDNSNNNASFKVQQQITGQTGNVGTKDVEMMVPLKYLLKFWRILEIRLINCEIALHLKCSRKCTIVAGTGNNQNPTFQINDTKLYVPVVALSTQQNINLLEQLESGFKRIINWNKYLTKTTNQAQNRYSGYLIDPSFQGVSRLFVLVFEDDNGQESLKENCGNKIL